MTELYKDVVFVNQAEDPVRIWQMNRNDNTLSVVAVAKPNMHETQMNSPSILCHIEERCLYIGGVHTYCHHGHMLIEGLARFYALLDENLMTQIDSLVISNLQTVSESVSRNKNLFITDLEKTEHLPKNMQWIAAILRAFPLAVGKPLHYVCQTTQVASLRIPPLKFQLFKYYKPMDDEISKMTQVFSQIRTFYCSSEAKPKKRLYLSRSGSLNHFLHMVNTNQEMRPWERFCVNEPELETQLTKIGFEIVFMENLTLPEQIVLLSSAEIALGFEGTNLHNSVFMQPGSSVVALPSPRGITSVGQDNLNLCNIQVPYIPLDVGLQTGLSNCPKSYKIDPHLVTKQIDNLFKKT